MALFRKVFSLGLVVAWTAGRVAAAYAPISEVEKGRLLTLYGQLGSYFDTNLFASPTEERDSLVSYVVPELALNWNPNRQTLVAMGGRVRWDHFAERPTERNLYSYHTSLRMARTFNPRLEAEVNVVYDQSRNPESLLPGTSTQLAQDQSREDLVYDFRSRWTLNPRNGLVARLLISRFRYTKNAALAVDLDRREFVSSVSWTFLWRPRARLVAENRGNWVRYRFNPNPKDKEAQMLLGGMDYSLGRSLSLTTRAGAEWRRREEGVAWRPYGEFSGKWDYRAGSYLSAGYAYQIEEVSNVDRYNDASLHRLFVSVQHSLTGRLLAGAAVTWEPTLLNTRRGQGERVSETAWQGGLSVEYKLRPRWSLLLTWDWDEVTSGDSNRRLQRQRTGFGTRLVY